MKTIRSAALILLIALLALFTSCGEQSLSHKQEGYFPDTIPCGELLEERKVPASKKLSPAVYAAEEILADIRLNRNCFPTYQNEWPYSSAVSVLGSYPTDAVRYVENADGGHYYAVYDVDSGGRLFVFFNSAGRAYGYPVYLEKQLSYHDFEGKCAIGDPLEKVIGIDPAAARYADGFPKLAEFVQNGSAEDGNAILWERLESYGTWTLTSVHLLTDGFLEIRYEYGENGEIVIRNMLFSETFQGMNPLFESYITVDWPAWYDENGRESRNENEETLRRALMEAASLEYGFRILPEDVPEAASE